jgi:hypothetical protein
VVSQALTLVAGKEDAGVAAALVDDLSGVSNQAAARSNLGLGTAATQASTAFDAAGAATAAQAAAEATAAADVVAKLSAPAVTGGIGYRPTNLDNWNAAWANRASVAPEIILAADSLGDINQTHQDWPQILQRLIGGAYSTGWVPASEHTHNGAAPGTPVGPGGKAILLDAGEIASKTVGVLVSAIRVVWLGSPGGTLTVKDGATTLATISTDVTAGSTNVTDVTVPLTFAEHALSFTASGATVTYGGFVGQQSAGELTLWSCARGSSLTSYFLDASNNDSWFLDLIENRVAAGKQPLVIIATGTGDASIDYANNVTALVADVRAIPGFTGDIMLLVPYENSSFSAADAAVGRATADTLGLALVDFSVRLPGFIANGVYNADGLHPNPAGSFVMARELVGDLTGDPIGAVARTAFTLPSPSPINAQTGTSYAFALTDANKTITRSNAGASTQTFPGSVVRLLPRGRPMPTINLGAGTVTFSNGGDASVTVSGNTTAATNVVRWVTVLSTSLVHIA